MTLLPISGWPQTLQTVAATDLARTISDLSVAITCAAVILLMGLIVAAVVTRRRSPKWKGSLFTLIVLISVITTFGLGAATVTLSFNSPTAGPVRWGTDYQIWACGNQLDLRDPSGLMSDRIGSPTLYEKNDGRIHYDGTPTNLPDDASLGKFMASIGGEISDTSLVVPLSARGFIGTPASPQYIESNIATARDGQNARFTDGQRCGNEAATVQVFAYSFDPTTSTYSQRKVTHPATYELSHSSTSPPGECLVVEFAPAKDRTDRLCAGYGVRDFDRCTEFGVAADKVARCDIREVE